MKHILTILGFCFLAYLAPSVNAQDGPLSEDLQEVVQEYFDALVTGEREALSDLLENSSAERKGIELIGELQWLREREFFDLEKMLFRRSLDDEEFSQLTPKAAMAAFLCLHIARNPNAKAGGSITGIAGVKVPDRKIVGAIQKNEQNAFVVYSCYSFPIPIMEDAVNVLTCVKLNGHWTVVPNTRLIDTHVLYHRALASKIAESDKDGHR